MKQIYLFLVTFVTVILGIFLYSTDVSAQYTVNSNGSVTITGEDIIDKIEISGTARKPRLTQNGVMYQLTTAQKGFASSGQVGGIYLKDRLSLEDAFSLNGAIESLNPYISNSNDILLYGDGQSLVFHGDDSKKHGISGSALGILGLKNAVGLAYDVYYNNRASLVADQWQTGQLSADPFTGTDVYFQGWSTDAYGRGARITTPIAFSKFTYGLSGLKRVTMSYSTDGTLTYDIKIPGNDRVNKHVMTVPKTLEYFYFGSTGSTGSATGTFNTYINSITYTPYRQKTLRYIDVDTQKELTDFQESVRLKLNDTYSFEPQKITGYDIVTIEGKLNGSVKYEESLEDEFIDVYVRSQAKSSVFSLTINDSAVNREFVSNKELIGIDGSKLVFNQMSKTVSKITITTPPSYERDLSKSEIISGWGVSEYTTNNKKVFQLYNSSFNNNNTENNSLKTAADVAKAISLFSKFTATEIEESSKIKIELSNYPMPFFEDDLETKKEAYAFPKLYNLGFEEDSIYENNQFNPLIQVNTKYLSYRGVSAEPTSMNTDDTQFLRDTLGSEAVATTDQGLIKGTNYTTNPIKRYSVKYNLKQTLLGSEEMSEIPEGALPQPVSLIMKDTKGKILDTKNLETVYSIGDTVYSSDNQLPKIDQYNFIKFEDSSVSYPIKVTDKKKEIVAIYEPIRPLWGTVPWEFNEETGELTFEDEGTFTKFYFSPWNRSDEYKIDMDKIKTITFLKEVKAPQDSQFLFGVPNSGLRNVTKINGLEKLDTTNANSMSNMFREMSSLEVLDLSGFSTSKVVSMESMFNGMSNLEVLDISNFNTLKVTTQKNQLTGTPKLKVLKVGKETKLIGTSLGNPSGEGFTGDWQSVGSGTIEKPTGDFVGKAADLEKVTQNSPIKETYVWEPKFMANITVNYYQLSSSGEGTKNRIIGDLEAGTDKPALNKKVLHQYKSIEEVLEENKINETTNLDGYEFINDKTSVITNESNKQLTLNDSMPKEDFTVNYYFNPIIDLRVPSDINFGTRKNMNQLNEYGMVPGKNDKDNKISIIDTYKNDQEKEDWAVNVSTEGFYNSESGVRLLADIIYKPSEDLTPITITNESTPLFSSEKAYRKEVSLVDDKQKEGLFVRVSKIQELGKYNGVLKYTMQIAP